MCLLAKEVGRKPSRVRIPPSPHFENTPVWRYFLMWRRAQYLSTVREGFEGRSDVLLASKTARQGRAAKISTAIFERLTESLRLRRSKLNEEKFERKHEHYLNKH